MKGKVLSFVVSALCMTLAAGCSLSASSQIPSGSLAYASYSNGEYTLYSVDPSSLDVKGKVELQKGWGDNIFKDSKGQIWCPVYYQPDMTSFENKVIIYNPADGKKTTVTVGEGPRFVLFGDKGTYVVCEEDGNNPTIYFVDAAMKASKLTTVKDGGLISGAQFDGQNIYMSSLLVNQKEPTSGKDVPILEKISLDGKVTQSPLQTINKGFNNVFLLGDKLYVGLQEDAGTVSEYDKNTLKRTRILPYKDMVGDFNEIDAHTIAVSNYSKRMQTGNKITFLDLDSGKVTAEIDTQVPTNHVSFIGGKCYVTDNLNTKTQILDAKGNVQKVVDTPTQVTNMIQVN